MGKLFKYLLSKGVYNVLLDDQGNVLIDEIDYVTGEHHQLFVAPERIDAINSYRNKEARIKKFSHGTHLRAIII